MFLKRPAARVVLQQPQLAPQQHRLPAVHERLLVPRRGAAGGAAGARGDDGRRRGRDVLRAENPLLQGRGVPPEVLPEAAEPVAVTAAVVLPARLTRRTDRGRGDTVQ